MILSGKGSRNHGAKSERELMQRSRPNLTSIDARRTQHKKRRQRKQSRRVIQHGAPAEITESIQPTTINYRSPRRYCKTVNTNVARLEDDPEQHAAIAVCAVERAELWLAAVVGPGHSTYPREATKDQARTRFPHLEDERGATIVCKPARFPPTSAGSMTALFAGRTSNFSMVAGF